MVIATSVEKRQLEEARHNLYPAHGLDGWEMAKYDWQEDGTARFMYVRDNGNGVVERKPVIRRQPSKVTVSGNELRDTYYADLLMYLRLTGGEK